MAELLGREERARGGVCVGGGGGLTSWASPVDRIKVAHYQNRNRDRGVLESSSL
jgi:hypothetical protein